MSAQVSRTVIASLEFARTGQTLGGSLAVAELTRLQDSLYDTLGLVDFAVQGGYDSRGRPTLRLDVSGTLHLKCQRCLGQLDFPLRLASTLLLASAAEAAASRLDEEEVEWIEASPELDVGALVEDEIILCLPYSPRHAEEVCPAGRPDPGGDASRSAFAKLAALRRNLN
ncbi:MAG TPA: YceD family protein [Burkholderiales bacterium]|nr:YceD family protein [Burkholderiales bacterium]